MKSMLINWSLKNTSSLNRKRKVVLLIFLITILLCSKQINLYAGEKGSYSDILVSAGAGMIIYQSSYGLKSSYGPELRIRRQFANALYWDAGFRIDFNNYRPEGFARLIASHGSESWKPSIGIEIGISGRADFDNGKYLLKESRDAMTQDIGNVYFATHVEMLSFNVNKDWNLSFLELNIGTHIKDIGRTIRIEVMAINICRTF